MDRTLVTGANGLVGYAMRKLDIPGAVYLTRQDVDLTDFEKTKAVITYIKPRRVVHLAAAVAGLGGNMIHSGEYFRNNIMINMNVLESCRLAGVEKLISFMSTCVFPDGCPHPLREEYIHDGPPHPSNFGYAYAKRMLEVQSSAYRREWSCRYIIAIPTNIYGPNDNWNLVEGHVLPSLIHKAYLAQKEGEELVVWGSGSPLREFIFAEDIARLSLWALDGYDEDTPIIFSPGEEISIRDLVGMVVKEMGFSGRVRFDDTKPDGQYRKPSDVSKLRGYLPDFRFTPIEEGIRKTVQWFLEHYPRVRT